jgi:hypothetical protein
MKKFVLISAVLALSLVANTPSMAQQTESNHSLHLNIGATNFHAGAGYTFEWAFAPKWTLLNSVWLKGEGGWGYNMLFGEYSYFVLSPSVSVEPRFYYNLAKREARGRKTALNSGNYLGTTVSCFFPTINGREGAYRDYYHFGIAPHWGLRRVYGDHFLLEFHAGILMLMSSYTNEFLMGPDLNLKIGYVF